MAGSRFRPAMPGCAIAMRGRAFGTLGCIVRDLPPFEDTYLLSAAHVIANSTFDPLGRTVVQPDGGGPSDEIGTVLRWGALAFTATDFPNLFDAAIARVDPLAVTAATRVLGRPAGRNEMVAKNALVRKFGAATGDTTGRVIDDDFHCQFIYDDGTGTGHRAGFQQQLLCNSGNPARPFSARGDSGAAVVDEDNKVVGLVVGRVPAGTVVCPIGPILGALGVTLA